MREMKGDPQDWHDAQGYGAREWDDAPTHPQAHPPEPRRTPVYAVHPGHLAAHQSRAGGGAHPAYAQAAALAAARAARAATPNRPDPAPSRAAYRWQRLWLRPLFRFGIRVGLPLAVVLLGLAVYFGNSDRRAALVAQIDLWRTEVEARPEFMVTLLSVQGATPELADAVRARLGLDLPLSSFAVDLVALRDRILELDAISDAELRIKAGGVLEVAITERLPVVLWRHEGGIDMLDATGHRVASLAARSDRPDLPLIAGDGADASVAEALAILQAATPIQPRLRGLVRVGERRWDVMLDRNQKILLPQDNPISAVERLMALHSAHDLLGRDILAVDLRMEHRPVLRLAPFALSQRRQALGILPVGESEL